MNTRVCLGCRSGISIREMAVWNHSTRAWIAAMKFAFLSVFHLPRLPKNHRRSMSVGYHIVRTAASLSETELLLLG